MISQPAFAKATAGNLRVTVSEGWNSFAFPPQYSSEVDPATEAALVEAMRRGDEAAFARLYAAHHPAVYRYALQMCGAPAADDIVQETFMALLRDRRFDPARGTLVAYLFGIARHHILKRIAVSRLESALGDDEEAGDPLPAGEATAFDDMSRTELVDGVRAAIQTLPPLYREVIVLCDLQELDYSSAAAVIECPVGTVRSRLHRARMLLRARLENVRSAALFRLR